METVGAGRCTTATGRAHTVSGRLVPHAAAVAIAGHAIPRIANRVLHLLPGGLAAVLVAVPIPAEIRFDLVPRLALVAVRRVVAEPVGRGELIVALSLAGIRPVTVVLTPIRVFGRPITVR